MILMISISVSLILSYIIARGMILMLVGPYINMGADAMLVFCGAIGFIIFGMELLLLKSFFIFPYILYFAIGYIAALKIYPKLDLPYYYKEGCLDLTLLIEIMIFYPVILIVLLSKGKLKTKGDL